LWKIAANATHSLDLLKRLGERDEARRLLEARIAHAEERPVREFCDRIGRGDCRLNRALQKASRKHTQAKDSDDRALHPLNLICRILLTEVQAAQHRIDDRRKGPYLECVARLDKAHVEKTPKSNVEPQHELWER
jgi:hypothetical protein